MFERRIYQDDSRAPRLIVAWRLFRFWFNYPSYRLELWLDGRRIRAHVEKLWKDEP